MRALPGRSACPSTLGTTLVSCNQPPFIFPFRLGSLTLLGQGLRLLGPYRGLDEKCPLQALVFEYLLPSLWR